MLCAVTDSSTMEFVEYEDVFNYLQGGSYPAEASEGAKRSIRRKSKKFKIHDGLLYYTHGGRERQWIRDEGTKKRIIAACHSDKLAGHFGRDKTREKISSRYYL